MMMRNKWLKRWSVMPTVLVAVLLLQLPAAAVSAVCPMTHGEPDMAMDHSDHMASDLMASTASDQSQHGCCALDRTSGGCVMIACLWMAADLPIVAMSATGHAGEKPAPDLVRLQLPPLFPLFRPPIA